MIFIEHSVTGERFFKLPVRGKWFNTHLNTQVPNGLSRETRQFLDLLQYDYMCTCLCSVLYLFISISTNRALK